MITLREKTIIIETKNNKNYSLDISFAKYIKCEDHFMEKKPKKKDLKTKKATKDESNMTITIPDPHLPQSIMLWIDDSDYKYVIHFKSIDELL
jgi:hypothetical protein